MWASGRPYTEPESRYTFNGVDGQAYQGVRIGPKNAHRLPARHRLDAGVTRRFRMGGADLDASLSLFNLYDRQNVWYRQYRLDTQPIRVRDVMMFLQTYGISPAQCVRLVKKYGSGAKRILQDVVMAAQDKGNSNNNNSHNKKKKALPIIVDSSNSFFSVATL